MNAKLNKYLEDTLAIHDFSEIDNFPFKTHSEFVSSIESGSSTVGIEYKAARELMNIFKLGYITITYNLMIWLPNILIILSVVLAIFKSDWIILTGIVSAFLGEFFANPYNPFRKLFILLTIVSFAYLFIEPSLLEPTGWLCFSFALSFSSIYFVNKMAWNVVYKAVLKSDVLTAKLFLSGDLFVKLNNGQYFSNKK